MACDPPRPRNVHLQANLSNVVETPSDFFVDNVTGCPRHFSYEYVSEEMGLFARPSVIKSQDPMRQGAIGVPASTRACRHCNCAIMRGRLLDFLGLQLHTIYQCRFPSCLLPALPCFLLLWLPDFLYFLWASIVSSLSVLYCLLRRLSLTRLVHQPYHYPTTFSGLNPLL